MRQIIVISDINIKGIEKLVRSQLEYDSSLFVPVNDNHLHMLTESVDKLEIRHGDLVILWLSLGGIAIDQGINRMQDESGESGHLNGKVVEYRVKQIYNCINSIKRRGAEPVYICASQNSILSKEKRTPEFNIFARSWQYMVYNHIEQNDVTVLYESEIQHVAKLSTRRWYAMKNPYTISFLKEISTRISVKERTRKNPIKVIAVDLDDTLWGGIIGEDGASSLKIGGIDQVGELYWDMQQTLCKLRDEGILVGLISKNNMSDVEVAFTALNMPLSFESFSFILCNWVEKSDNIVVASRMLNLSLENFAFIDDSPLEREKMRYAHPEVLIISPPEDKFMWPAYIDFCCSGQNFRTSEDKQRSSHYRLEKERIRALEGSSITVNSSKPATVSDFLQVELKTARFDINRALQLFNRTNQFNLSARRLSLKDIEKLERTADLFEMYAVKDRFGDYGVTGLVVIVINGGSAVVTDFMVSCRALGRNVEYMILERIKSYCLQQNCKSVHFAYNETSRNIPMKDFLAESKVLHSDLVLM